MYTSFFNLKIHPFYVIIYETERRFPAHLFILSPSGNFHPFIHNRGRINLPLSSLFLYFIHSFGRRLDDDYHKKIIIILRAAVRGKEFPVLQEFIVNTSEMNRGLSLVTHALAARPVKSIYNGVQIDAKDNTLVMTATDGEMTIRAIIDADVRTPGLSVFPAKLLSELIRRQNVGAITFTVEDSNVARITSLGSKTNMMGMNAEDFPEIREISNAQEIHLPAGKLRNAISRVMFAVSTDESRKTLTGILMEFYGNETRLVSIDGFRMALMNIEAENEVPVGKDFSSVIITGRILNELSKILPDDDTDVTLSFNASHVVISFGTVKLFTTLLIGEFIDYKHILPSSAQTEIELEKAPLYDALERCSLMAREGKSNLITMEIGETGLLMNSRAERGDVHEEMPVVFHGLPLKISFNSQYLMDVIRNVETDEIRMCFQTNVSPCIVRPKEGNQFTFLVLPIRTFN